MILSPGAEPIDCHGVVGDASGVQSGCLAQARGQTVSDLGIGEPSVAQVIVADVVVMPVANGFEITGGTLSAAAIEKVMA